MAVLRPSNIPWIGDIPQEWRIIKLKYASQLKGRIGWQGLTTDEYRAEGPYLVTGTDFDNGVVNWERCQHVSEERYRLDIAIQIKEDDLLITKDGTIGKVAISKNCPEKVCLNSGVFIIRNTGDFKYNSRFMYYVLQSEELQRWFSITDRGNNTIKHLTQEKFYNFSFAYPAIDEQQAIADYLDDRCSKLDEIITEAEKSIEEYKELKQAVIFEAVTKRLDKNAPMKDSGIDIIGKIPVAWTLRRLRYLCDVMTGNQDTQDSVDDGEYPFYVRSPIVHHSNSYTYDGEGILMAGDGAGAGRVFHHAYGKYAIHQRVYCFYGFREINTDYFYYFISELFAKVMDKGSAQSTVPSVRLPMLKDFYFCLPSVEEQEQIVNYLNVNIPKYDSLISEKQSLIEDLKAYKKSLIYEVVTGKRRVV